ncbi:MarR family winged helix-turn-helix transcriptional regulator [Sphingobium lactosutens]|uniref:MarR family transcriptional regulator n=1 Tax=Sphingobium lactosutens DS20 TaxID=1331060 RepID=T0HL68_9SPHN|nr:MarR family transcriptional regulator [Sphingobium lactosutens]EQB12903.1 MarR family transcriptional regulator [Sphingobium lactosutens DS20]
MTIASLRLDAFLPYRLSFTTNLVSDAVASAYEEAFGLRIPEWRVVAVVAEHPDGVTPQAIGLKTRMDKVTVSRAASALVDRGLLQRTPNPADQRSHLLMLSTAGTALYQAIVPQALALEEQIFGSFTQAERAQLVAMLRRIDAIVLAGNMSASNP